MVKIKLSINGYEYRIEQTLHAKLYFVAKQQLRHPFTVLEHRMFKGDEADKALEYFSALLNEKTIEVEKVG